jgi:WD40 repeat protein
MIALWNVNGRKLITRIGLHTAPVYAIAFSPDGERLVSGGHDKSVRLYTRHSTLWGFRLD